MKYLAFDIEAANGYSLASVCCIGIVIADEQFNIIHKKNYWINPKCKYNLNGTRANIGINLNLDKKLLDSSPTFVEAYDEIKQLLTDSDTIVIGHAVDSDVLMLNAACTKFKLPCINFKYVCTQLLFKLFKQEKDVRALIKIANEIGIEFTEHLAEDDALVSMLTLKYLLMANQCNIEQILDKYSIRIGCNNNFEVIRCVTLSGQIRNSVSRQMLAAITKAKEGFERDKKLVVSKKLTGYVFSMCSQLAFSNIDQTIELIKKIYSLGARYTSRSSKCTHYIHLDNTTNNGDNMRYKHILRLIENGAKINIIDMQTFLCMLDDK